MGRIESERDKRGAKDCDDFEKIQTNMTDQKTPTKFCKDCANFRGPDLCFVGETINVINGEKANDYGICRRLRMDGSTGYVDEKFHCGSEARRFVPIDKSKPPAHRSSIGFVLREWFFGK